jgi:hypothetical protein
MLAERLLKKEPRYRGFRDPQGRYISFATLDDVFERAREVRARILLRLELTDSGELVGVLYTDRPARLR